MEPSIHWRGRAKAIKEQKLKKQAKERRHQEAREKARAKLIAAGKPIAPHLLEDAIEEDPFADHGSNLKKKKDSKGGQSLSARIRGVERLLAREDIPEEVRKAKEKELEKLLQKKMNFKQIAKERHNAKKYHGIKFVERQKLTRKIKQLRRQLGLPPIPNIPTTPEEAELQYQQETQTSINGPKESDEKEEEKENEQNAETQTNTQKNGNGEVNINEQTEQETTLQPTEREEIVKELRKLEDGLLYILNFPNKYKYISIVKNIADEKVCENRRKIQEEVLSQINLFQRLTQVGKAIHCTGERIAPELPTRGQKRKPPGIAATTKRGLPNKGTKRSRISDDGHPETPSEKQEQSETNTDNILNKTNKNNKKQKKQQKEKEDKRIRSEGGGGDTVADTYDNDEEGFDEEGGVANDDFFLASALKAFKEEDEGRGNEKNPNLESNDNNSTPRKEENQTTKKGKKKKKKNKKQKTGKVE